MVSSTDAASVFSILRSKKLGLKEHTDSMLELESGSNDPCSYMMTIIILSVMDSGVRTGFILYLIAAQFVFGILFGIMIGFGTSFIMRRFRFATDGFDMAFITGIALLSYAAAATVGGNGYLSAYLCGIILGNQKIYNKKALVHFFDGITDLMQMLIFFLLGLLAAPSKIPSVFLPAFAIMLFLTLAARPLANLENDVFHIVFCIVLLSITFQGTLLPFCAKWFGMIDQNIDVLKTFSDYSEDVDLQFIKLKMKATHPWTGKEIQAITLPPETLIVMLLRDGKRLIPDGQTTLCENDIAVLCAFKYDSGQDISLQEHQVLPNSKWIGKTIRDFSPKSGELVIMIIRNDNAILPKGRKKSRKMICLSSIQTITPLQKL